MVALRAHYATAHDGWGPTRFPGEDGDFLEDSPAFIASGYYVGWGLISPLPHWPPYWAQVWGDIVMRVASGGSGTAYVDLVTACAWFHDDSVRDEQGYELKAEELIQSFEVTSTSWTTFQIPVREMLFGNPLKESDMSWNNPDIDYDNPAGYWYPPFSGTWYQHTYLPWIRVNSGPAIEVKMLRLWDQPTCATDLFVKYRLTVPGVVDNFPGTGDPLVVYGDGIWKDNSDTTYAPFCWSDPSGNARTHGALELYTGGVIRNLTLHFRASASGDTRPQPFTVHLHGPPPLNRTRLRFYGGSYAGAWAENWDVPIDFEIPVDGKIRDFEVAVNGAMLDGSGYDAGGTGVDQLRDYLTTGCYLHFDADNFAGRVFGDPSAVGTIRIYEAWLTVS